MNLLSTPPVVALLTDDTGASATVSRQSLPAQEHVLRLAQPIALPRLDRERFAHVLAVEPKSAPQAAAGEVVPVPRPHMELVIAARALEVTDPENEDAGKAHDKQCVKDQRWKTVEDAEKAQREP